MRECSHLESQLAKFALCGAQISRFFPLQDPAQCSGIVGWLLTSGSIVLQFCRPTFNGLPKVKKLVNGAQYEYECEPHKASKKYSSKQSHGSHHHILSLPAGRIGFQLAMITCKATETGRCNNMKSL